MKLKTRASRSALLRIVVCIVLVRETICAEEEEKKEVRSAFPDRTKPPGLDWPKKCWWMKEITPDLHISGRLTERQIKYAADCGVKTIISLYTYLEGEQKHFGRDRLLSTEEERHLVEEVAGMKFLNIMEPNEDWVDWSSADTVRNLTKVLPTVDTPVLLHCHNGHAITFVTLMYLANQTRLDPNFRPRITSNDFYNISAAMGLDFTDNMQTEIVAHITGEPIPLNPPKPNTIPKRWEGYWMAHPVYKNWFSAGQISKSHIKVLEEVGFINVINLRSGITLDGRPNQEEVNLLNIKSDTGTYATENKEPRQWKSRLEMTRINFDRPKYFIYDGSPINYESTNPEEFGDDVGYQEPRERNAFEGSNLKYYHMPVDGHGPYSAFLERVMPKILEIGKEGPVLVKCTMGKRAAYIAVLAAALQYDKDLDWALRRTWELGFEVSKEKTPVIYHDFFHWLVTKRIRDEL